jgi:acyl-homoserine-lactone acylase
MRIVTKGRRVFVGVVGAAAIAVLMIPADAGAFQRVAAVSAASTQATASASLESLRWKREARGVTITRDDWGIAHIAGKTDADAVFGMIYAQCEDDFNRVEMNYLYSMGRLAEAEGEGAIWQDLRMKIFMDPEKLKGLYAGSPEWLKQLMTAWADGLNFYMAQHPEVKPRVIDHFEPWMALSFTEGSIGGDIERVDLKKLADFYSHANHADAAKATESPLSASFPSRAEMQEQEPSGSNGIAIAPSNTAEHHALLLINPHTSFFFRSELQMTSAEGLNAYGAVTWGQFFVYQGFNDRVGWMHTSSNVDAVDEFLETVSKRGTHWFYKYGNEERRLVEKEISVPYKTPDGMAVKKFTVYFTGHGPIIRAADSRWIAIKLMQKPVEALEQSYLRTKARSYAEFRKTMELKANSSNNTVFADADGAYFHGNFIPRRDTQFNYTNPVDGSNPATDWHGLLAVDETPHLLNPKSGYLFNVNNWPWAGSGESSLKREDYPAYVETGTETERGVHAIRLLKGRLNFTPDSLMAAAYDSYLPWFDKPLPPLFRAWDELPESSSLKAKLAGQVAELRNWDQRWGTDSVATSLAVFWGTQLRKDLADEQEETSLPVEELAATKTPPETLLRALDVASDRLTADFGSWKTPWGQINRFQRITGDIVQPFNDVGPSIPVGFVSSVWGSLASFGARPYPGTKRWYGTSGNSFVAVVEFGNRVRARAVTAGGESGHPDSRHFDDEAERYSMGNLRDVYFYPEDLKEHTEKVYSPGAD